MSKNRMRMLAPMIFLSGVWAMSGLGAEATRATVSGTSPRFTIQADSNCVVDNLTGLMWARHANLPGGTQSWAQAVTFCKTLTYGGHTDWRLPHITELRGLMTTNYLRPMLSNAAGTAKWQEGDAFKSVKEYDKGISFYWATTTTAGEPAGAWLISFFSGQISPDDEKTGTGYVWPVRGEPGARTAGSESK